jgi:hypothetical protein
MLYYIYSPQLCSIGANLYAKSNVVIRDLKTRYMLFLRIKYPMYYSIQSLIG